MSQWRYSIAPSPPPTLPQSPADLFFNGRTASVWLNQEIENEPQPFTGKVTYHDPSHLILDNEVMLDRKLIVLIRMENEE